MSRMRILGLAVAVGLAVCSFLAGAHGRRTTGSAANDADMRAIEKLHQQDVSATLARDPQQLADLFTDDAVLLEPDAPAVVGKAAILVENKKEQREHPESKIVSYKPEIKDLQVVDGWAFEWDVFEGSFKESEKAEVKTFHAKALRVLKREPDGSWKFARVMWNMAEGQQ
jgi:uncharacterized protein (TIGR02246 family)